MSGLVAPTWFPVSARFYRGGAMGRITGVLLIALILVGVPVSVLAQTSTPTPVYVLVTATPLPVGAITLSDVVNVQRESYALQLMLGVMTVGVLALLFTRKR